MTHGRDFAVDVAPWGVCRPHRAAREAALEEGLRIGENVECCIGSVGRSKERGNRLVRESWQIRLRGGIKFTSSGCCRLGVP